MRHFFLIIQETETRKKNLCPYVSKNEKTSFISVNETF